MHIILLSGGSGTRLWPLSNDARSKQFLKILTVPGTDQKESMVQRVVRQLKSSRLKADVTVATSVSQRDSVLSQLGEEVDIVTEPSRRNTFPAICLACEYLAKVKKCPPEETIVVMPCDPFTDQSYFTTIEKMADAVTRGNFEMTVMGIKPTYPSSKYGYVIPSYLHSDTSSAINSDSGPLPCLPVESFTEKPDVKRAETLIEEGALWNGGVFSFRLGYMTDISDKYLNYSDFNDYLKNYDRYPKISFDYEVAEKAKSIGVVPFDGYWKDLGTWNTLTDELKEKTHGNVLTDNSGNNTHVFNELSIPMLVLGTDNLVIAASPDGIIVSEKSKSENIKSYATSLKHRPMYEERRWGTYKVIDYVEFPDNFSSLTKQLTLNPGCSISYQRHSCRDEVWTFINGEGEIVIDGVRKPVKRGDVINIPKGRLHALRALTSLSFIEVQHGSNLVEEDIERFDFEW